MRGKTLHGIICNKEGYDTIREVSEARRPSDHNRVRRVSRRRGRFQLC